MTDSGINPKSMFSLAFAILNEFRGGITTDDEPIPIRLIMRMVTDRYAEALYSFLEYLNRNGFPIDSQMYLTYQHISVSSAGIDYRPKSCPTSFIVKRVRIPKMPTWRGYPTIRYLGGTEMDSPFMFGLSSYEALMKAKGTKYVSGGPAYWIDGNYAYLILPPEYSEIEQISYELVPSNPSEQVTDACFDYWSDPFSVPDHLWTATKDLIFTKDTQVLLNGFAITDVENNSTGRIPMTTAPNNN